jgi:cyclomaltodextrinase / maltogenic alpha-amylase / neopullulanase
VPADTPAWVRDAVFYQILPDRFAASGRVPKPGPMEPWDDPPTDHGFKGGNLLGIVERLDYLEQLGVNALYLTPVFASASNHRYHAYDYYQVDPLLGGNAALRELLEAAHARGMRVILDGVFNHCGRGFWPFHHVMEAGSHSPYRDWFHLDADALRMGRQLRAYGQKLDAGIPEGWQDEHAAGSRSLASLGYRAWWDLPALPKLNVTNPATREYLLGVAEHWIAFGADGWRLDVPEEIEDPTFWSDFRRRVRAINPDAYLVGEIWGERPEYLTGDRFDALMNYPLLYSTVAYAAGSHLDRAVADRHGTLRDALQPLDGQAFAAALAHLASNYPPEVIAVQLNLLGSHDTPRVMSLAGGDRESVRLAVLVQMTFPGAPCIYYGDEIGLIGGVDPDNRRTFPTSESGWDRELLAFVRSAIALRAAHPVLRRGSVTVAGASGGACAYLRSDGNEHLLVALNAADHETALSVRLPLADGRQLEEVRLDPHASARPLGRLAVRDGGARLVLPARRGSVLRVAG